MSKIDKALQAVMDSSLAGDRRAELLNFLSELPPERQGALSSDVVVSAADNDMLVKLALNLFDRAKSGTGPEPVDSLRYPQTAAQLQARLGWISKFTAGIPGLKHVTAATVVADDVLVTYAHMDHSSWQPGQRMTVEVHNSAGAKRRQVWAVVTKVFPMEDIIFLKVDESSTHGAKVEGAALDAGMYAGEPYFLLGQSTQAQPDMTSTAHGRIAATELDGMLHIRGDMQSGSGDSGGGVFAAESGKLLGVCVGNDETSKKSIIVPTAILLARLK